MAKIEIEQTISTPQFVIAPQKKVDKSIRLTPGLNSGEVVKLSLAGTDLGT